MYDDFYDDTRVLDAFIDEFKNEVMEGVKEEYIKKMERLLRENKELQEVKREFDKIKQGYRERQRQLGVKEKVIEDEMTHLASKVLMRRLERRIYKASVRDVMGEQCGKCDEYRYVTFKSPSGKALSEKCECGTTYTQYFPEEMRLIEIQTDNYDGRLRLEYKGYNGRWAVTEGEKKFIERVEDFATVNFINDTFRCEELCQKYCDWRNEKEMKENGL